MNIAQSEAVYGDEERAAVVDYLDSGRWLTEFEETEELEAELASETGASYATVTTNGTVSLMIALMALGIGDGDQVIVPNFTFVASAYAVSMVGADPVLVDVDRETFCLDLDQASAAVSEQTEAIIYVTLNGRSHDMNRVVEWADENDLALVEDAAQSLGSTFDGRQLGTFGDVGTFSFSYSKIMTTGQGGAVVTDDEEIHREVARIKDFGRPESGVDQHERLGFNAKFTDLQAVIGQEQLAKLDARVRRKQEIYDQYRESLATLPGIEFPPTNTSRTAPYGMDVLVHPTVRPRLATYLDERGIETRTFYPPIHTQEPYETDATFPVSIEVSERGLWLPSSVALSDDEVAYVCDTVRSFMTE